MTVLFAGVWDLQHTMTTADPFASDLEQTLAGDPRATERLIVGVTPAVSRAVRSLLGPHHPELDDAVQDALIRLLDALPRFRRTSSLRTFAIRIATRAGVDVLRRQYRRRRTLRAIDLGTTTPGPAGPVDPRDDWVMGLVASALSAVQLESLVLRALFDYSVEEIAAETGAEIETVRSRLRLAREALRRKLVKYPEIIERLEERS